MDNARKLFDKLRQEVTSGKLTCDDIIKRLTVAIEIEYLKETPRIDFIETCEDFLWEIETQGQQTFISANQQYLSVLQQEASNTRASWCSLRFVQRLVAIAAVLLLCIGLSQGALRFYWFSQLSDSAGEIHIIQGHEVTIELIQSALAKHESYSSLATQDWEELCTYLGFTPSIAKPEALLADNARYSAYVEPGLIIVDTLYENSEQGTIAVLKNEYYIDPEEAYLMIQQDINGDHVTINGYTVYQNTNLDRISYTWLVGTTLTHLSGTMDSELGFSIVDQLTGGIDNE